MHLTSPTWPVVDMQVLGTCFRMLSAKGHKDTVVSTATATVRQAVALVFSYVDVEEELARIDRVVRRQQQLSSASEGGEAPAPGVNGGSSAVTPEASGSMDGSGSGSAGVVSALEVAAAGPDGAVLREEAGLELDGAAAEAVEEDPPAPTVQAAHQLLEDLCAIATGGDQEGLFPSGREDMAAAFFLQLDKQSGNYWGEGLAESA
jgi:hypothetical protein